MADPMKIRATLAGDVVEVRVLLQHPMETGYRPGPDGRTLPRNILRRLEARFEGELVFAADLFPAIAANPYLAFPMRATVSGSLLRHSAETIGRYARRSPRTPRTTCPPSRSITGTSWVAIGRRRERE